MCHLDIHPDNLILDDKGTTIWLLDWAFAGAYPPFFEEAALSWGTCGGFIQGLLQFIEVKLDQEKVEQLMAIGFGLTTGAFCQPKGKLICYGI